MAAGRLLKRSVPYLRKQPVEHRGRHEERNPGAVAEHRVGARRVRCEEMLCALSLRVIEQGHCFCVGFGDGEVGGRFVVHDRSAAALAAIVRRFTVIGASCRTLWLSCNVRIAALERPALFVSAGASSRMTYLPGAARFDVAARSLV